MSSNERNSDDLYSETVKFKRALGGQFNISITDSWSMMFDLKYDLDRLDNIAKGETKYQINSNMILGFGLEMIKAPDETSYWSPYRTNDTVYTSFGYHF